MGKLCDVCKYDGLPELDKPCIIYEYGCRYFELRVGSWIEVAKYSDGKHKIQCSECGNYIFDRGHANSFNVKEKYKYCPSCGANMDEVVNNG